MASVTYENVTKRFGNVIAVNDLNIQIPDKEFLIFVGPSGCGKTTSLRLLAGLEELTEGTIYIGDRLINDVPPKDRDIAMVFQSYALYPHMTVYENMAFGLRLHKTPKAEIDQRVKDAARDLGILELLDRRPKQLSGGQSQRVAVGRAIVRDPAVFLMDEPLSNLDAKLRVEARTMISKLHQRLETTFIYVTHDQTEAMTMGTRIAVMRSGLLQQIDAPQVLYETPANVFVAGFIGSPSMNFFEVTLVGGANEMYVQSDTFKLRVPEDKARVYAEKGYAGKEVILGVRPSDISDPQFQSPNIVAQKIKSRVDVTELMGNEIFLYLITGKKTFVARVDPRSKLRVGDEVEIVLNMAHMHIFDRQNELAVR
ncbi:MAG: ABC transporter ATP-binding protein [Anaerolineae bacterium]|nr:ABC transporter ATP-binding protein [Anaerolineae bacterium]